MGKILTDRSAYTTEDSHCPPFRQGSAPVGHEAQIFKWLEHDYKIDEDILLLSNTLFNNTLQFRRVGSSGNTVNLSLDAKAPRYNGFNVLLALISTNTMSIDQLMQEALSLPNDLRLQLVEKLLDSLEVEVDESIQCERLLAAQKRRDDIRNGLLQPIPGEEALAQVRQLLG